MDPYDEIVEQLRNARDKGLQSVKDRLDGVLVSLDAASGAVRDALALETDDLVPLGQAETAIEELKEAAIEAAAVPPPVVTIDLLRELDGAGSQSDLLHGLLSALTGRAARAVVLVFRPEAIGAWSAIGFDDASRLEKWSCDRGESPLLDGFVDAPTPQLFEPEVDPVVQRWLEEESMPTEAMLVPISLRGKTMGAVYVDRLEDRPWDPEGVQVLVAISCWMIDTLKYRAGAGSPMLTQTVGATTEAGGEAAAGIEAEDIEAPADSSEVDGELPPEEEHPEEAEGPTPSDEEIEVGELEAASGEPTAAEAALDEIAADPDFDPSATVQVEAGEAPQEAEVTVDDDEPVAVTVEDEGPEDQATDSVEEIEVGLPAAETDVQVPPPVKPVVPPSDLGDRPADAESTGLSPEDESRHEEARRFARLLVSEIKLYNEDAVRRGREQRDLYARLREDIDRSREMFERRIPPEIRTTRDYFHEELVRILGDGDSDALGM